MADTETPAPGRARAAAPRPRHDVRALRHLRAEDVMSRRVVTIDGSASVAEAVRRMREERVSTLVIDRRGPEDAWGIVSRTDIIRKVVGPGREPATVAVHEIMTKPVVTVSPGLALKFCLRLMDTARVRRAVVFDGHALLGVLSHGDVFAALEA
jgi:CBS domain-containing protein